MSDKFPSYRYGPDGQSAVFNSAAEVPKGWEDHPSKVEAAAAPAPKAPAPVEQPAAPSQPAALAPATAAPTKPAPALKPEIPLTRSQIAAALQEKGIPFSKNTPTSALYDKLLAAQEAPQTGV